MSELKLSIILPVFNEGESITEVITGIEKVVKPQHETLVVFDFKEDNTVPYVKKLQKKYKTVKLIKNMYGRGLLNAVKTGFKTFSGDIIVVMPADLADDPNTINKMFEKIMKGYDIVCATRYTKGGKKNGGGFIKTSLSRFAGLTTPLILGIPTTDIANGFKMYRKKVLTTIQIESDGGWEYSCELIVKAHSLGFKISEVPTIWRDRSFGKSKFKLLKWLPKYLRWYLSGIFLRLNIHRLTV